MNAWYQDAITSVYSRAKAICTSKLKKKYPELFITDEDDIIQNPKFPTVYFNFLAPSERGRDLQGNSINAISLTVQIEVYGKDKMSTNEVSSVIVEAMKSMYFEATMPTFENNSKDYKRSISRYQRVIGYNDTI